MTPEQVSRVLAAAALRDNRHVGPADVMAWLEDIGDLDPADALTAVSRHYRSSTERLMPAHVRRIVAELNRQRGEAERSERLRRQLEALDSVAAEPVRDRSPEVKAMLAELAEKLGRGRPEAFRRPEWLENDRVRERMARAEPNPHYTGPPPQGGWPLPELEAVAGEALPAVPESAYPPDATPLAEVRADIHAADEAVLGARDSVRAALAKLRELREPTAAPTEAAEPTPAEETQ